MFTTLLTITLIVLGLWALARFVLAGRSHRHFDSPHPPLTGQREQPSEAHQQVVQQFREGMLQPSQKQSRKQMLGEMRKQMDAMGADTPIDGQIVDIDANGVPCEWVVADGADPLRRVLYLHGGAFTMGSPRSHRPITIEYSKRLGAAVLAVDYRLMPEHTRADGIEDCHTAYEWILDNGPDGPGRAECVIVSGDSAGGNLTLMITAYAQAKGLRAPDAAVALSPLTDATFESPTLAANVKSDAMLGPMAGAIVKTPRALMLLISFLTSRLSPANPMVSPLHGDLIDLPPTLLHASTAEMLLGDSVRYFNKASTNGNPVQIGLWPHMLHVWHIFDIPEAKEAFDHIEDFLRTHVAHLRIDQSDAQRAEATR